MSVKTIYREILRMKIIKIYPGYQIQDFTVLDDCNDSNTRDDGLAIIRGLSDSAPRLWRSFNDSAQQKCVRDVIECKDCDALYTVGMALCSIIVESATISCACWKVLILQELFSL